MTLVDAENPMVDSQAAFALSDDEIEEFALQGYVVKRQVLDPDLMSKAVDLMWGKMPQSFNRGDPSTWRGDRLFRLTFAVST